MQAWYTQYPFTFIIDSLRYDMPLSLRYDNQTLDATPRAFLSIPYQNPNSESSTRITYGYGLSVENNTEDVYYLCYYKMEATGTTGALTRVTFNVIAASMSDFDLKYHTGTKSGAGDGDINWTSHSSISTTFFTYHDKTVYYGTQTNVIFSGTTTWFLPVIEGAGTQQLSNADFIIAGQGTRYYAWLVPYGENQYINDPYNRPPQEETPRGGNGTWDNSSDVIEVDPLPAGLWGQGFVSVYVPTVAELQSFATEIWSETNVNRFNDIFPNGMTSGIVDCFTIPIQPDVTTAGYICMGGQVLTTTQSAILANRFKIVDFGSITMGEYFGAFPDYMSTKIAIYLPYIGWEEIAPEMCINATINLQYKIDCLTGDFVAIITTNRTDKFAFQGVSYTFNGNCATRIPLTARTGAGTYDYVASAISGLTTIAAGVMTGNPVAVAGGTLSMANSMLSMNDKHTFALKGGFSGAKGQLTSQRPYLVINRPVMENGANNGYFTLCGAPSNDYVTMGACAAGTPSFTKAMECIIDNSNFAGATDTEKNKIYNLLKAGVII